MKYSISAEGHSAGVNLTMMAGKFAGTIFTEELGSGTISGTIGPDGALTGSCTLDGHQAGFSARIAGQSISGALTVRLFLGITHTANFTGQEVA